MIVASVSGDQAKLNAKNLPKAFDEGLTKGLIDAAYELLRLSQQQVPLDEGTLQNSGTVETDRDWRRGVTVGYHTPYAAHLHEHPEYNFQHGRKGKYLEDPLMDNMSVLNIDVAIKVQTELGDKLA